jgi:Helicase conserved C-terminal domain
MDTYADWLRGRSDDELRSLLSARPELINPMPAELGALAARATTPAAVSRAVDRLDRLSLAVLEALLVLPQPAAYGTLKRTLGLGELRDAVDLLRSRGLVWGTNRTLRSAPGVRQVFPYPAGLGPPAAEALAGYPAERLTEILQDLDIATPNGFADPERLVALLADRLADPAPLIEAAGPEARAALELLAWGPPVGRIEEARRPVRTATARSPIERLLACGLLAATDDRRVTLPREVALYLRGGRLFRDLTGTPPPLAGTVRSADLVDRTAGGQAFTTVRLVEELLERWGIDPPPVLRNGGLAVRELRATAGLLDIDEPAAALVIEVAYVAGLLARTGSVDGEWLPTKSYDLWRLQDTADRWAELVTAWLATDRVPGLAGERDERDRVINALADESVRSSASEVRRATLATLATTRAGPAPDAVREYLAWQEPRRGTRLRERMVGWALHEAELLGLTGLGALAPHARVLLEGGAAAGTLGPLLPQPVDHVLLQADLTAVAPGPLVTSLARELSLMADVESTGGATVYRFTPASVRRALDVGRPAAELIGLLTRHSATPVPQPLRYLIEDVARRHGHLRVGTALSYVRSDDPATLEEIVADRRAAGLRLYRLAPTVLVSGLHRGDLLEALRLMGLAPVAESPEGGLVVTRPDALRAETSAQFHSTTAWSTPDPSVIAAAVRALRAGDEAARHSAQRAARRARRRPDAPAGEPPRSPTVATVDELRDAVSRGGRLWIGYLDQQGRASSRIVQPVRVEGGFLTAYDTTRDSIQRFALHRITGVAQVP